MARDADFYDGMQWSQQDAQVLTDRGQAPLVFNQIKVGDIELNMVEGIVVEDGRLPVALLGMSFLKRTNLNREGERLTISPRY